MNLSKFLFFCFLNLGISLSLFGQNVSKNELTQYQIQANQETVKLPFSFTKKVTNKLEINLLREGFTHLALVNPEGRTYLSYEIDSEDFFSLSFEKMPLGKYQLKLTREEKVWEVEFWKE